MWEATKSFLEDNATVLSLIAGLTLLLFVAAAILVPVILVRMPADYFLDQRRHEGRWRQMHPALVVLIMIARNLVGVLLIIIGIVMLVTPGQGLLTIFVGFMALDFPGKYRLERRLVGWKPVCRSINWLRRKFHREPLQLDHAAQPEQH